MEKLKNFIINNKFNIFLTAAYLIITLITMFHHELWRDEAQVWCLARDLKFCDFMNTARIEGHPYLWYMLIFPFAKLGANVFTIQIISWIFVSAAAVFLIFKSSFNIFFKTMFVFNAGMLYYLPIVARNYALIPLFLFLLAYIYPKRKDKPYLYSFLIVLLSQTHVLIEGFCGFIFLFFAAEKIAETLKSKTETAKTDLKILLPLIIPALNFLLIAFSLYNSPNENIIITNYMHRGITLDMTILSFTSYYLSIIPFFPFIVLMIYLSFFAILYNFFKSDKKIFITFAASFVYILAVLNKFWFGGIPYQKIFIIFLIMIFCTWVLKDCGKLHNSKILKLSLIFLFAISLITSYAAINLDIKYNFSGGKQLCTYIKENLNNENTFIAIGLPYTFSTISAYMPEKKLYFYQTGKYLSFFNFNKKNDESIDEFPAEAAYYIVQENYTLNPEAGFEKIFETDMQNLSGMAEREVFALYKKNN